MKKIILLSFASLALCLAISSCDNGAYTATPGQTSGTNPVATTGNNNNNNNSGNNNNNSGNNNNNGNGNNNGGNNTPAGTLVADIDGTHFSSTVAYWSNGQIGFLIYGAMNPTDPVSPKSISIQFGSTPYNGPGTYDISSKAVYSNGTSISGFHYASSGSLTVTSDQNNVLKGTFHFSTSDGMNVTNGSFNLNKM